MFYQKKENLSSLLIQTLDALTNERPNSLKLKRMHFDLDKKTSHAYDDIEYMRILAERERIHNFKTVASESAYIYYKILKRITEDGLKKLTEKT